MKSPSFALLFLCLATAPISVVKADSPAPSPAGTQSSDAAPATADAEITRRADALLARMTLEEKIGQLTQIGPSPRSPEVKSEDLVRQGGAGSMLWTLDTGLMRRLQEIAVKESRLGIPMLFGFDVIHGYKNVFPVPIAMASSWDPALVERSQAIAAKEAAASGINWTFGPMLDIARDARWGRMVEGAGEDPYLGEVMARAQVRGFQGPQLGTPGRVLASAKHFVGYGASEGGRDYDSCYVPGILLHNLYLRPFRAAIDAGVGNVMSAYMCLNDVPAGGNAWLLRDVLRGELGFRGFVVSDSYTTPALVAHGLARDEADAAAKALNAGVNVDMGSETYLRNAANLVRSGRVPVAVLDSLVHEVLETKLRLGLFERPYIDPMDKDRVLGDPAHRAATRVAAQRSMVLLRNEGGILPLKKSLKSLAVIGPLADSAEDVKGPWTAEWSQGVSVLEGLRAKLPHTKITAVTGGDTQRKYPLAWDARAGKPAPTLMTETQMRAEEAQAVKAARKADAVVLVLGERASMSGEDASSSELALGGNQQRLLEAVVATGKPVVLVLMNGRPLNITWAASHVSAILEAWYPGVEGGNAIADILLGDVNPGGKLPVTWPRSAGQCPIYYNHNLTQSRDDDPTFTSRYATDSDSSPLYPFGHGLSYTRFTFSNLTVAPVPDQASGSLEISVDVSSVGPVAGDEVIQIYTHQRAGSVVRPARELKAFRRETFAAGETRTLRFAIPLAELRYWNPQTRTWILEPGTFDLWVGGDSKATLHAEFTVTGS
ncbi:MAG: beta-glucosidase BglX [Opitutae bacterium]|nr:beta-glucosidase BglX [Opitutae bacterium]